MGRNNGIMLPQQQAQPMVLATPFNDVQTVAWIAAQRHDVNALQAVEWAMQIVAEAIIQTPSLPGLVEQKRQTR
jgi:hypothetical protein